MNKLLYTFSLLLILGLSACSDEIIVTPEPDSKGVDQFSSELALKWNELMLDLERFTPGFRPPVSGRTFAYIGLAAYESVQPGMADKYNSFSGYFPGLTTPKADPGLEYYWPAVLNAAYAGALARFFATAPAKQAFDLYALERHFNDQFQKELPNDVYVRSREFGRRVAEAVFAWSATDAAGHQGNLHNNDPGYVPPTGTGLWQPTYPDFGKALLPHWGEVRTFAADAGDVCADPVPYSEKAGSAFYQQAEEVRRIVNQLKAGQEEESYWIADFWSDDCPILTFTPAGRWIAVANQVIVKENATLDRALETYARLGMALSDAGVRSWGEKYRLNVERPVDYIRRVLKEENWNTVMCPDGSGNFYTPPFPAYPSGHATFGAAAAEVLTDLYGPAYPMTDRCHEGRTEFRGQPRAFDSFHAMAEENAYSRIPIGVHFRMDSEAGLTLGSVIGKKVNALPWRK